MNNILIEKATKADHEDLSKIAFEAKSYWGYPDEWMRMWKGDLLITEEYIEINYVFKLFLDNELIGFIGIEEDNNNCFYIENLWIRPKYIGLGFGKKLLNEVLTRIVKPGAEIIVESDPNAEVFYSKQGFVTFDKRESYPKGRFLPLMKKIYP